MVSLIPICKSSSTHYILFAMPSVVFSFGDTSKEVGLEDINSPQDVDSIMKEVMDKEKEKKDSPHKKNTTNG